jgi:hypothetical protein
MGADGPALTESWYVNHEASRICAQVIGQVKQHSLLNDESIHG